MKKTVRNLLILALALAMVLSLAACSQKEAPAEEKAPAKAGTLKIGVTLMNFSTEFSIGLKD